MSKKASGYTKILNSDLERQDIKGYEKYLYLILLRFKNNDSGEAYPSQKALSNISGLSIKTINRCTQKLIDNNIIKAVKSQGKNNIYTFIDQRHRVAGSSVTESLASQSPMSSVTESLVVASQSPTIKTIKKTKDNKEKEKEKEKEKSNLPDWLNKEAWLLWVDERNNKMKKPLTDNAIKIHFKLLKKYSKDEQRKIIENSINNRWQGLFELKNNKKEQHPSNYLAPKEEGKYDEFDD